MLPTVRAIGNTTTSTGSLTVTLPTHQEGDLLLIFGGCGRNTTSSGSQTISAGGWTQITTVVNASGTTRGRSTVWALRASSGAVPNPSITASAAGTTYHYVARAISITSGTWNDTGILADAWESVVTASAPNSSVVALTGLTTTGIDRLCLATIFQSDDNATGITNDGSYLALGTDSDSTTGSDGYFGQRQKEQAAAGAAGATFTLTAGGTADSSTGIALAILPNATAPVSLDVPAAQATSSAGGVATSGTLVVPFALATSQAAGLATFVGLNAPAAQATATGAGILISFVPPTGLQIGTASYPTATTWSIPVTGVTFVLPIVATSSDDQTATLTVEIPAQPHVLRAVAGGAPAYATLVAGAQAEEVELAATAGGISLSGTRTVPAASTTTSAGGISTPTASSGLPAASVTALAGGIQVFGTEHVIRAVSNGPPAYATLVPGVQGYEAQATTAAGAIALAGELPAPSASATATGGDIGVGQPEGFPAVTLTTSAGAISIGAQVPAPAASVTATAGGIALTIPLGGATATTSAGTASWSAQVPAPYAQATSSAGAIAIGVNVPCPYGEAISEAAGAAILATLAANAATATTSAGNINLGIGAEVGDDAYRLRLSRSGFKVELTRHQDKRIRLGRGASKVTLTKRTS